MIVKRFYAETSREALRLVRQALGNEAMILGNRKTANGVEVMAVAESEVRTVTGGASPRAPAKPAATAIPSAPQAASTRPQATPGGFDVVHELRLLRSLMEEQVAALAWNDLRRRQPARSTALRKLLSAGFSVGLARKLVDRMPEGMDEARGLRWTKAALQAMLNIVPEENGIINRGGVFALVGPTGVGKTTTVAKLAAQATLRYGANHVALVTTDTYRIGAVDQLRVYAKILGVPVISIKDETDMRVALGDLRSRRIVLIDTIGMGQRDRRLVDQVALLCGEGKSVQRLLLLSAISQTDVLAEVVNAYKGASMAGCVLTKLDESLTLGGALDVLIRHKMPLYYVTNGQRVPEDLHRASPLYLVERAIRLAPETGMFAITDEDVPYLFAESAPQSPGPFVPSPARVSGAMGG
jgi:flagellar biosynthesis protein FlhF